MLRGRRSSNPLISLNHVIDLVPAEFTAAPRDVVRQFLKKCLLC